MLAPRPDPPWKDREKHRLFLRSTMELATAWFQLICFLYVAMESILMAMSGDHEKSINWALVAIIIKPYGNKVENPLEKTEKTK